MTWAGFETRPRAFRRTLLNLYRYVECDRSTKVIRGIKLDDLRGSRTVLSQPRGNLDGMYYNHEAALGSCSHGCNGYKTWQTERNQTQNASNNSDAGRRGWGGWGGFEDLRI